MQLLANGKQQFLDANGAPLAGGLVYHYAPGTTNPVATYKDQAGQSANTNPIQLDSRGQAVIWGAGTFRQVVTDSSGVTIWDQIATVPDANAPANALQALIAAASGASVVGVTQAGAGAVKRTVQDKLRESISFYDFGAVGDGAADDTAAILATIAAHLSSGIPIVAGAGRFKVSAQVAINVSALVTNTGISIKGAGRRRTVLISSYSAGVPFLLTGSNAFFHSVKDIGFEGGYAGPIVQIGKNDFSDAFNSCSFKFNVNNSSVDPAAEGVRLNYVLQSDIDIVANCGGTGRPGQATTPGNGTAVVLRQTQFSRLMLAGGNANIGLKLTVGYNFGNTFHAIDLEEVNTGLQIESQYATQNSFVGGQIVATYCINNTSGGSNILQSVNLSPYSGGSFVNGANIVGTFITNPGNANTSNKWTPFNTLPGTNAATLRTEGPDVNIQGEMYSKGTSGHVLFNNAGNRLLSVAGGTSLVNYPQVQAAAAGADVQYTAQGADTNINIFVAPKGSGSVKIPLNSLPNYVNDAAAATGGVPVSGLYRNGSVIQVRVA